MNFLLYLAFVQIVILSFGKNVEYFYNRIGRQLLVGLSWFLKVIKDNFSKINLTKEDLKKKEQYVAKIKRDNFYKNISHEDFLESLDINDINEVN